MGNLERWDEIKAGLDLVLGLDPFVGWNVDGTDIWMIPLETVPLITVYYVVDKVRGVVRYVDILRLDI
jgi:hypothetical protein